MAKESILDRADARLRGGSSKSEQDSDSSAGSKAGAARSTLRRRSGGKAKAEAQAAAESSAAAKPKTTVRRRRAGSAVPAEAAKPAVEESPIEVKADEAEVPSTAEETPESDVVSAPEEASEQAVEAATEATDTADDTSADAVDAAADEDVVPPSIDDLLSSSPRRPKRTAAEADEPAEATAEPVQADAAPEDDTQAEPSAADEAPEVAAIEPETADETEAAEPAAADAAEEPAAESAAVSADDPSASLEDLLKEQGIVQHKPKKGRRIIEDEMTAGIGRVAEASTAPPVLQPSPPRNKPVRFLDPASIQRDREARSQRGRGKRKSVVQRQDALYGKSDRRRRKGRAAPKAGGKMTEMTTPAAHKRVIKVHGGITVADLANQLGVKGGAVVKLLVGMGQMVTLNEVLDIDTAQLLAAEFEYEIEDVSFNEEDVLKQAEEVEADEDLQPRAPVVTIMGHVDHGKTSLLDLIRESKVADGEAGGITQHVSAFDVVAEGSQITFVDTPGHAAFTAMRARGAEMTDIVVLVVAATEGVMPQTVEVIAHAKAAGVPIIVALNKMDLAEANPDKTRQQLSEQELISEQWGGDVQMIEVSAKTGDGVDSLLDSINVQAEILELKANPNRTAVGRVVEAQFEKGRGPVSVVLIQKGTLKTGDIVVAGTEFGRVRALSVPGARKATKLDEAGPSTPVAVLGLSGLPEAGDEFAVVENEKAAKSVVEHRKTIRRERMDVARGVSLDDLYNKLKEAEIKELNLIVKADVQGSIEALRKVLSEIEVRDTRVKFVHAAVGGVTAGDVTLAEASRAVIIGFGVRPDAKARDEAERAQVEIRHYRVIYEAVDDIKQALVGMLDPEYKESVLGHAEVRNTFKISKIGVICGSFVQDGKVGRNHHVRVLRNSVVSWEGKVKSLRRFKDDVKEVLQGYECGIGLDGFDDVKVGDVLETFIVEEIAPQL